MVPVYTPTTATRRHLKGVSPTVQHSVINPQIISNEKKCPISRFPIFPDMNLNRRSNRRIRAGELFLD